MRGAGYVLVVAASTAALAAIVYAASVEGVDLPHVLCWLEMMCAG